MKRVIIILTLIVTISIILSSCVNKDDDESLLKWIPEKSYFTSYSVKNNIVIFGYMIHFVNNSTNEYKIRISAKFKSGDLKGWIKNKDFFEGCDEDGNWLESVLYPQQETDVVFWFEGEYLGGIVNDNISFPEELIIEYR